MVLTRSMCKSCASVDGGSNATSTAGKRNQSTNAHVYGDTARVAADNHTSVRSRRTKSSSALKPNITTENKLARSHSRVTVPRSDTVKRSSGQKSSRGTKQQQGHQATKHGRGSQSSTSLAGPSAEPIVGGTQKQNGICRSDTRGTKRNRETGRETDEDAPESEAASRSNSRCVRRRILRPEDGTSQRAAVVPEVSRASECDARSSCQALRRSARLASKSSRLVPQGRCSSTEDVKRIVDRAQECNENEPEGSNPRRVRRRIRAAAGQSDVETEGQTSGSDTKTESSGETLVANEPDACNVDRYGHNEEGSSSASLVKNEDIDQDWLVGVDNERHASVDTVTPAYWRGRESSEPRSSSVESLLTPPPLCTEEEEEVLLHHDFDAMIPLDSLPDEDERDALSRAYLRQLQETRPDDEADVEVVTAGDRYRSLAPEPDQGLADAIRSGRISGLASPERSMREE
ncbi:hypothetical protein ACEPAI_1490 [Sanghuangporus weigelae]